MSTLNDVLQNIYLPAIRDEFATHEIRMYQMFHGGRMPPIRWHNIRMLEPWWPARALAAVRRARAETWSRATGAWGVLLHGDNAGDGDASS